VRITQRRRTFPRGDVGVRLRQVARTIGAGPEVEILGMPAPRHFEQPGRVATAPVLGITREAAGER
jgi:hypothetical protein